MHQLTRKADYGLRLMLEAGAAGGALVTVGSVAQREKIPYQFLRQAARTLHAKGLLTTSRGPHGGVRLARTADTISVLDVADAFGGIALNACTAVPPKCDRRDVCAAFPAWVRAQAATERVLAETSLGSLLRRRQEPSADESITEPEAGEATAVHNPRLAGSRRKAHAIRTR